MLLKEGRRRFGGGGLAAAGVLEDPGFVGVSAFGVLGRTGVASSISIDCGRPRLLLLLLFEDDSLEGVAAAAGAGGAMAPAFAGSAF